MVHNQNIQLKIYQSTVLNSLNSEDSEEEEDKQDNPLPHLNSLVIQVLLLLRQTMVRMERGDQPVEAVTCHCRVIKRFRMTRGRTVRTLHKLSRIGDLHMANLLLLYLTILTQMELMETSRGVS